jgi:hypothetical protein
MKISGGYLDGNGNFDKAIIQLIINLKAGKPHKDILAEWDYMRGTDWYCTVRNKPALVEVRE